MITREAIDSTIVSILRIIFVALGIAFFAYAIEKLVKTDLATPVATHWYAAGGFLLQTLVA
ncbi:MAG: hypothetical protein AAGA03_06875 [Planctomycetota bacterium]